MNSNSYYPFNPIESESQIAYHKIVAGAGYRGTHYISDGRFAVKQPKNKPIEKVIFNGPATIVFWNDGSKTVVKVQDGDTLDYEKGLAMAICKKALGNKGNFNNIFREFLKGDNIHE